MKGDFSRDSFNLKKNFSRVLMQQGRVQLDADWNEQSSILLNYMRQFVVDLIGQHAGLNNAFAIEIKDDAAGKPDLFITPGIYYVGGIRCECSEERLNDKPISYFNQPNYRPNKNELPAVPYLIYLDVWERHITCFEDESLCEVALGGIDTTTRAQVVWQLKVRNLQGMGNTCDNVQFPNENAAFLSARTQPPEISEDPCNIQPDARYRGAENQLYRVEVHTGSVNELGQVQTPTFKWSRENGSVVFPVMSITEGKNTTEVRLTNLGRDDKFSLREGDWVELVDDVYTLNNRAGNLMRIASINRDEKSVSLTDKPKILIDGSHPLLRRWDQKAGNPHEGGLTLNTEGDDPDKAAKILEEDDEDKGWLKLEDGIQIKFKKNANSIYRTGDYWLIPARTATGDVVWSKKENGKPQMQPPNGIEHHYAPLAIVNHNGVLSNCHNKIIPIPDLVKMVEDEMKEAIRPEDVKPEAVKTETDKTKRKKPPK